MKWKLKTWPGNHHSHVKLEFKQLDNCTKMKMTQTEVPIGEKEIVRRNWPVYYWDPIKKTFGYGASF